MSKYHQLRSQEISQNVACDLAQLKKPDVGDLARFCHLYYSLEFAIGQVLSDEDTSYYPNASFSILRFIATLKRIQNLCGVGARFLDVGCGLGNKVWIAQEFGFDAHGIEVNEKYVEIARNLVGPHRVLCHDATTYADYGKFDVIYFFNPMPSGALEAAVLGGARQGALIFHATTLQSSPTREHCRVSKHLLYVTGSASAAGSVQRTSAAIPRQVVARRVLRKDESPE
jgi:SAM-dependent methyltransferase